MKFLTHSLVAILAMIAGFGIARKKPPKPPPSPPMCQAIADVYVDPGGGGGPPYLEVWLPPGQSIKAQRLYARDDPNGAWQSCAQPPPGGTGICNLPGASFQSCGSPGSEGGAMKYDCNFHNDGPNARDARMVITYTAPLLPIN